MSYNPNESVYIRLKPRSKEQPHGKLTYGRINRTYLAGVWTEEKPSAGRASLIAFLQQELPHSGAYRDFQHPIFEIKSAEEYKAIQDFELRRRRAAEMGIVLEDGGFVKPKPIALPDPSLLAPAEIAPSDPAEIKVPSATPSLEDLGISGGDADDNQSSEDPQADDSQGNLFAAPSAEDKGDAAPQTSKPSGKKSK